VTDPLRVLSISTLFPNPARPGFGGFVARQAEALAARGDVALTLINPVPALPGPLARLQPGPDLRAIPLLDEGRGFPVHHARFPWLPRFGPRWNAALIARAIWPLVRQLHTESPFDLVDAQFFFPDGPAAARIAARLGLRLSIKARGSDIHHWGAVPFARRQMLAAARVADGMLAVSAALMADMAALGMDADRIAVHYTGLDHATFRPRNRAEARRELAAMPADAGAVPVDMKLVVTTGNLIPLKGQALVIRALEQLPGLRLLLAGSGPDKAELQALAASLNLTDRVHFGYLKPAQMAVALAAADAMALPSEREGLANAWIEALACGTPLVITDVGGAREVVHSPAAGRLVDRDPGAIAAALAELLASPPDPADVAAEAARFSWQANADQLAAHYRRLISIA
jgi:teichuronic acid biosynthesis glycosyltransferase TuaC